MNDIKFCIMTPVYNVEPFLKECVDSVIGQTYKNFELILVDDGSTDNSGAICDGYAAEHSFIKAFHKQNGGLMSARQYALRRADGDYYIFLDSDDWLESNALETVYDSIKRYGSDCVVYGYKRMLNGRIVFATPDEGVFELEDKAEIYRKCFGNNIYNPLCRKAVKSCLFKGKDYSGYYYLSHGEDLLQSIEVYKNCNKMLFIDNKLYNYRINPDSITQKKIRKDYKPDFTIRKLVLDFLKEENVFSDENFIEYKNYCIKLFFEKMNGVAASDLEIQSKKLIFDRVRQDDYCKDFILSEIYTGKKCKKRRALQRFANGNYRSLLLMGRIIAIYKRSPFYRQK